MLAGACAVLVSPGVEAAQDSQPKPAVVRGRVVAADTGRPLRRSQITFVPTEGGPQRIATTNTQGRYDLIDVAPGRYTVSAGRSGYLRLQYGQRRSDEQARPVHVRDGEVLDNLDFSLPRMGSITGRILDDAGEPLEGAIVWALRPLYVEGRRQLAVASGGFEGTDDRGEFRLTGLPPGSYYVRALSRETWTVVIDGTRQPMGFAPTFYPGTATAGRARAVEVATGQRVRVGDLSILTARPAAISGVAIDSKGQPLAGRSAGLSIRFLGFSGFGVGGGSMAMGSTPIAADGSFTFLEVPAGEYDVSTSTGSVRTGDGETARASVVVDGVDVSDVRLVTSAGWSVTGRITTEDGLAPTFTPAAIRVGTQRLDDVRGGNASVNEVHDDFTFTMRAILGRARLTATPPEGWMVKSIMREGRDLLGATLDLRSGEELSDVEIVVSNRLTAVTGQLRDDRGASIADGTVVIFSDDAAKWGAGSAFVRAVRPDQEGRWEVKGLPAGQYLAAAIDFVEYNAWNDPEYLESLRRQAQRVFLSDAAPSTLTLRVITP
jgi:hypothetical protein